ncbi:penicillin-binding protein 2 [Lipingzhangella sp. LS1_29]|uniref:Penicillin-binding protein 2 n=1 Tax=Lipingzhangella rawalii TaxID=2055835 RepID=A0ABU2H469_9ACTN|nr:penicillin-binding protein 2 [Lipingzhangella rawalii]MDS1269404.1 penicillin-binding protein 2 [Lipingzhangella rawalii]
MLAVVLIFTGRLVQIQGIESATYAEAASDLRLQRVEIPTTRGEILDATGDPLAISVERRTVFVDPVEVNDEDRDRVSAELADRFDRDPEAVAEQVAATPGRYEVIARNVPPAEAAELRDLDLPGVGDQLDYERVYPQDTGAANLVGFVGDDGAGMEGLEAVLDADLAGEPGQQHVEVGASGARIPMAGGLEREPEPGRDVRLHLDQDIQWHAFQTLAEQVDELGASGGSALVMRPTGEILGMANYPSYDANEFEESTQEERRNAAVADAFEPGSTNKVITAAAALENGITTADTVYTVPYSLERHGETFTDSEYHETQRLTLNGIMATSSNVGTIQVAEQVGAEGLYDYLGMFGFGQPSGLDLPGENAGILTDPDDWWGTQLATISFGQGLSVNAVQAASVYATIANGGVRVDPSVVDGTIDEHGDFHSDAEPARERVVSAETAEELTLMLEAVMGEHGTGSSVRVPGYRVAGKTGTAQRVNPDTGTYEDGGYTATFVGFAPAEDPELVVQVVLDDPEEDHYGASAAGPVFVDVMEFGLQSLDVPPSSEETPPIRIFED